MNELNKPDNFNFTKDMFEISYSHKDINFDTSHGKINNFLASLKNDDFKRSEMSKNNTTVTNLEERSSWIYKEKIKIYHHYSEYTCKEYDLIKYEEGDFFNLHKDSKGTHTLLIFCPSEFEGGDLILKKDNAFEIKIKPSIIKNSFMMLKFSTDFLHKVTPIIKGSRYILKSYIEEKDNEEYYVNDNWDGGLDGECGNSDDY